ncbi:MAG: hypothetical protein AB7N76_05260 [Planctomycetota bacterium]
MTEVATRFLSLLNLGVRWDSRSGDPRILAAERDRAAEALNLLHATSSCLVWPGAMGDPWHGCPPGQPRFAGRRNPFVGHHVDEGEILDCELDDEDFDDEDGE